MFLKGARGKVKLSAAHDKQAFEVLELLPLLLGQLLAPQPFRDKLTHRRDSFAGDAVEERCGSLAGPQRALRVAGLDILERFPESGKHSAGIMRGSPAGLRPSFRSQPLQWDRRATGSSP